MTPDDLLGRLTSPTALERVYKLGDVPASPKYPYAVIDLDTGRGGTNDRDGGGGTKRVWTAVVQIHSRSLDGLLDYANAVDAVLYDRVLPIPDRPFSRRDIASRVLRDPDDGTVLSLTHVYRLEPK